LLNLYSAPPAYQHAVRAHEGQKKIIKRVSRSPGAKDQRDGQDGQDGQEGQDGQDERPDEFEEIRSASKKRKRKMDRDSNVKNLGSDDFSVEDDVRSKRAKTPSGSGNSTEENTPNASTGDNNDNNSNHSNNDSIEKSISCFDCQKTFSSTGNLNRHLFTVHNIPNQNFHSDSNASLGSDDASDVIAIDVIAERSRDDDEVVKCDHCNIDCFGRRALRNHVKFKVGGMIRQTLNG
jgi:hypothetical protein